MVFGSATESEPPVNVPTDYRAPTITPHVYCRRSRTYGTTVYSARTFLRRTEGDLGSVSGHRTSYLTLDLCACCDSDDSYTGHLHFRTPLDPPTHPSV